VIAAMLSVEVEACKVANGKLDEIIEAAIPTSINKKTMYSCNSRNNPTRSQPQQTLPIQELERLIVEWCACKTGPRLESLSRNQVIELATGYRVIQRNQV
jgi:hypothetical protein